jgi:hypothetical protein
MKRTPPGGWALAICVCLALVVSVLWEKWEIESVRTTPLAGTDLVTLDAQTVLDRATTISDRATTITGETSIPAEVRLVSQGVVLQRTRTGTAAHPEDLRFSLDVRPFVRSAYGFTIQAEARQGLLAIRDSRSVEVQHRGPLRPNATSFRRELWLHLSYERVRYRAKLTFPHDDPFAAAFEDADMPLVSFLRLTVPYTVTGWEEVALADLAMPRTRTVVVTPGAVTVTVDGDSAMLGSESVPIGDHVTVGLARDELDAFKERARPDILHVLVDGYTMRGQLPRPLLRSRTGYATWYASAQSKVLAVESLLDPALDFGLGKIRRELAEFSRNTGLFPIFASGLSAVFALVPPLIALSILVPAGMVLPAPRRQVHSVLITAMIAAPLAANAYRASLAIVEPSSDAATTAYTTAAVITILGLTAAWFTVLRRLPGGASPWDALVSMAVAVGATGVASAIERTVSPYGTPSFVLGPVLSIGVVLVLIRPVLLRRVVRETWPTADRWAAICGYAIVLSLALNVPLRTGDSPLRLKLLDTVLSAEFGATRLAAAALVVVVLLIGVYESKQRTWTWDKKPWAIAALWAAYVVGTSPRLFTVPVALGLAVVSFRWIALVGAERRGKMEAIRAAIARRAGSKARDFARLVDVGQIDATHTKLRDRVLSGDVNPGDYRIYEKRLHRARRALLGRLSYPDSVRPADIAFGFGVDLDPWKNGVAAAKAGAVLALLLLAIAAPHLADQSSIPLFTGLASIAAVLSTRVAGAFLFGYFFAYVRGTMGVTKALAFSAAAIVASLPVWLLVGSRTDVALQAVSWVLFFGLIGAWFDAHGWKTVVKKATFPEVFALAGLGNFAALGTFGLTALGTLVTGQLQKIFPLLLKAVVPQLNVPQ